MKNFKKLVRYIIPYWKLAVLNGSFNILGSLFGLFSLAMVIPFLGILFGTREQVFTPVPFDLSVDAIQHNLNYLITSVIVEHGHSAALLLVSGFFVTSSLLKNTSVFFANFFMAPLRNFVIRDLRNNIFRKIVKMPLSYYTNERKGDIISRMTSDVQEVEWSIMSSIEMIFRDPVTIILYFTTLVLMSSQLTLFAVMLLPISILIISRIGKSLKKQSRQGQRRMGILVSTLEETLTGMRIIKAFNAEDKVNDRFTGMNNLFTRLMIRIFRRRYLASPLSEFMGSLVMIILTYYGGSLVLGNEGSLSSEEFIAYIVIFSQIINPAKSFSQAYYNIQKGLASLERIEEILNADIRIHEKENPIHEPAFSQAIEYRDVYFRYETEDVLKNINAKIQKGSTIALVGPSGGGKSTFADLLPRFFDTVQGEILIDGIPIRDFSLKGLRSLMGIVTQQPILFNDSFFNNIAFGKPDATEEEVIEAAKIANAWEFISQYPNHIYTNIGECGDKLSGGQKQRISIARAVLKNPPILILDEATSALDTESERLVQDALTKLMANRTSIVIAHRLSTIVHADEILVIDHGEITERGKHDELLKQNGLYRKLYEIQNKHVIDGLA
jgi:subfamily B ATP-binding cassette protein MsbA